MKPRDELKDVVWETVTSILSLKDKAERIAQHTDQLAIGRWVSVEERLPEESGCYLFVWDGGEPQWIDFTRGLTDGETPTHWLELDLPEVVE